MRTTVHALEKKFNNACTAATFLASQGYVCDAAKLPVSVQDLAVFKYLLPDEIELELEDTPTDAIFGDPTDKILVFGFADKRATKRELKDIRKVVEGRMERFERSLQQYLTRRKSLDQIYKLAEIYLPSRFTHSPVPVKLEYDVLSENGSSHEEIFNAICSELDNVLSKAIEPKREAEFGPCMSSMEKYIGVTRLWLHQSKAIEHLNKRSTNHLVVSTATASGKSLIFHSLVKRMLEISEGTALFIYPTKALAQDQLRSFSSDLARTFDGDTTYDQRQAAKQYARVLLVNPDILHTTLLPNWKDWSRFLGNLRYVVIDELHYYSGVFGAHVACVIRRLRRLCAQLGADPCQYIACSATLSDPSGHMAILTGLDPKSIMELKPQDDCSPSGTKRYVSCCPNFLTPADPSTGRMHPIAVAAPLLTKLVKKNIRVIAFCRFRRECELLLRAIYETDPSLVSQVRAYRGGYSPNDRRKIEAMMFSGQLKGVVATTALEVGIDIGNLDAAIICGFPHSIASFRQQVGRIGRSQHDSMVFYVADGSILDQNYARDFEKVLHSPIEQIPIVLHESIVRSHVQAAAYELAMDREDLKFFPECEHLASANLETVSNDVLAYLFQPKIDLRKAGDEHEDTAVIDIATNEIIEHVEYERVGFTLYDGGIFIQQGKAFIVTYLDPDLRFAKVKRTNVKWTTRQRDYTDVDPLSNDKSKVIGYNGETVVGLGQIQVTNKVFGYFKFDQRNQIIDCVDIDIPPNIAVKSGFYINLTFSTLEILRMRKHHISASIHAAEHVLMSVMPIFVSMTPGDVGTECKAPTKELYTKRNTLRQRPARLIFYEKHGGKLGNGILVSAYNQLSALLERACETMDRCDCESGCGGCIGSGYCVEQNAVLSKNGAKVILRNLLNRSLDGVPLGPDANVGEQEYVTVVPVEAHTH